MRKTSVRKFIHMVIDILPLLIIPIFALNILHKETEPISIEVQEKVSVDFNQYSLNGDFSNDRYSWSNNYSTLTIFDNSGLVQATGTLAYPQINTPISFDTTHKYLISTNITSNSDFTNFSIGNGTIGYSETFTIAQNTSRTIQRIVYGGGSYLVIYGFKQNLTNEYSYIVRDVQVFDLTQMGLENITIEEFNSMFPSSYYEYTESQKMLVNKPSTTTYNDTDIGSQFVYALYKPVHDYFNFNNLFNMGAIYNWIELNLFSGTAPLPIFIIWNVIVYEFFVDLIFLLYGVFMFIIDFAEKCLERPFRR